MLRYMLLSPVRRDTDLVCPMPSKFLLHTTTLAGRLAHHRIEVLPGWCSFEAAAAALVGTA